ncbi:MAG: hypothetical protein M3O26_11415 [Pseudomonadota bacterium]|nr:hypothetical protein [Pseudomonadota bacterium]
MLSYAARTARDGNGFKVSFPDMPDALPRTLTREEALALAARVLTTAVDFTFKIVGGFLPRRRLGVARRDRSSS